MQAVLTWITLIAPFMEDSLCFLLQLREKKRLNGPINLKHKNAHPTSHLFIPAFLVTIVFLSIPFFFFVHVIFVFLTKLLEHTALVYFPPPKKKITASHI